MRIAVVGAGAMGSLYAGMLARADKDVWLIGRSPAHIDAIRADGLRMRVPNSCEEWRVAIRASTDPADVGPVDVVLILTKSYDLRAAAAGARALFGPSTWALPLSNGLGTIDAVAQGAPGVPVAGGVSEVGGDVLSPGLITITENVAMGKGFTRFGAVAGSVARPQLAALAAELEASGLRAEVLDDVLAFIWTKLAMAGTMSSLSALTRLRIGKIAGSDEGWQLIEMMIGEIAAVAQARGICFDRDATLARGRSVFSSVPDHVPSMAADLREGRRTENSALAEAVAREGARLGVATPMCHAMYRMISLVEANPGASIW
jgi:2-dehydropantoate 2-reductase